MQQIAGREEYSILIRGLGGFDVVIDDKPVQRWRAGKTRKLLQFLLLRQGRIVSREMLYDALWPDAGTKAGSSSLKVAVHMLRNVMAAGDGAARRGSSISLQTCEAGYVLHTTNVWVDFQVFDRLVDKAHQLQLHGNTTAAIATFREAIELYKGDFLPGVAMDWAEMHREWLRSRALLALHRLTEADLGAGDDLAVMRWCQQTLEIDPYHEQTYRVLMHLHAQLGQLDQVRRWYSLCRSRLQSGLEIAPDRSTRELLAAAMRGDLVLHSSPHGASA